MAQVARFPKKSTEETVLYLHDGDHLTDDGWHILPRAALWSHADYIEFCPVGMKSCKSSAHGGGVAAYASIHATLPLHCCCPFVFPSTSALYCWQILGTSVFSRFVNVNIWHLLFPSFKNSKLPTFRPVSHIQIFNTLSMLDLTIVSACKQESPRRCMQLPCSRCAILATSRMHARGCRVQAATRCARARMRCCPRSRCTKL